MSYSVDFEHNLAEHHRKEIQEAENSSAVREIALSIIGECDQDSGEPVSFLPSGITALLFTRMEEVTGIQLKETEYGYPTPYALTVMHLVGGGNALKLFALGEISRDGGEPTWHKQLVAVRAARDFEASKL